MEVGWIFEGVRVRDNAGLGDNQPLRNRGLNPGVSRVRHRI